MSNTVVASRDHRINWVQSIPFFAVHLFAAVAVFFVPFHWSYVVWALALYYARMWAVTAGYHRYFAHRTFKTSRAFQFLLAFLAETSAQKGVLWWAANHRHHHRESDQPEDLHSPLQDGFWWSHVGWILCDKYNGVAVEQIHDLEKYPELRFINKHDWIGPWAVGATCFLIGGWSGLLIGFFASTVLLWHTTFMVNSVAHVFGRRPYETTDTSRNSLLVALATGGEGWHNNHHRYPWAARQGFRWWQLDPTYYVLRGLQVVGIVSDLRPVPVAVIDEARAAKVRRRASGTSPSSPR
jgi:stearoyl-CoA desaturase (Delta-9 desaturase)